MAARAWERLMRRALATERPARVRNLI